MAAPNTLGALGAYSKSYSSFLAVVPVVESSPPAEENSSSAGSGGARNGFLTTSISIPFSAVSRINTEPRIKRESSELNRDRIGR